MADRILASRGTRRLFFDTRSELGIVDCDLYNFDDTGCHMLLDGLHPLLSAWKRQNHKGWQAGMGAAIVCIGGDSFDVPMFLLVRGTYYLAKASCK